MKAFQLAPFEHTLHLSALFILPKQSLSCTSTLYILRVQPLLKMYNLVTPNTIKYKIDIFMYINEVHSF